MATKTIWREIITDIYKTYNGKITRNEIVHTLQRASKEPTVIYIPSTKLQGIYPIAR